MSTDKITCPICGKQIFKVPHFSSCNPDNLPRELYKEWVFLYNHTDFINQIKDELTELYVNKGMSVFRLNAYYNLPAGRIQKILRHLNIPLRNMSQAASTLSTRQKYKDTCMEKYGAENALSRGTVAFEKKNATVLEKYGVDNVRKHDTCKNKITQTMLEKFGKKRISKYSGFKKNSINKLESRISAALTYLEIPHMYSKYIAKRQFDFLLTDTRIVIEVQGDFWHANPKIYKESDKFKFCSPGVLSAGDIWKRDLDKKIIAEKYGYEIVYLWEQDINLCKTEEQLYDLIRCELRRCLPGL